MIHKQQAKTGQAHQTSQGRWARAGFSGKSVWDWLELLIVPVVLTVAGLWFSGQLSERQEAIEDQRTQDAALQSYLDQMSELMLHNNLNSYLTKTELTESPETYVAYGVAKARTATVLARLDSDHNKSAIRFLIEGGLTGASGTDPFSIFWNINLQGVDFSGINLSTSKFWNAELSGANLANANLSYTDLTDTNLTNADLTHANLTGANLSDVTANISEHTLNATAGGLIPPSSSSKGNVGANLTDANLTDANLKGANLTSANLFHAIGITGEQLEEYAASLTDATMPNGQKYEEWIKDPRPIHTNVDNTIPAGGALRAGEEYVTEEFKPTFHFKVDEGWQSMRPETSEEIVIANTVEGIYIRFTNPPYAYSPSNLKQRIPVPENFDTDLWMSWFQGHQNLDTTKPVPEDVGDTAGLAVEVTDISPPADFSSDYCGQPCVPLLSMSSGSWVGAFSTLRVRFVSVDVGSETVVVVIQAPADKFQEVLPMAREVLDTVDWQE